MNEKGISQVVIGRLPRYYRFLGDLKEAGTERISSQELSVLMQGSASQIRQDLNHFGGFGQQGYGYNVSYLHEEIGKILGMDREHKMILVGAGHLGQALLNYANFAKRGFVFTGVFDADKTLIGKKAGDLVVQDVANMGEFLASGDVDIAVLTIPKEAAVPVAKQLTGYGIRAIWNFAHVDLDVPKEVQVESVHLSDSLLKLSYNLSRVTRSEESPEATG